MKSYGRENDKKRKVISETIIIGKISERLAFEVNWQAPFNIFGNTKEQEYLKQFLKKSREHTFFNSIITIKLELL